MTSQANFQIHQGTDVAIEFQLFEEDGTPKNLDGYSVHSMMKKSYNSGPNHTHEFQGIISDEDQGWITLAMTNEETDAIIPGRYLYDVEIAYNDSDGNSIITRILEGTIDVTPSVTR